MDPTPADASEAVTPQILFRPGKKRKIYRQRAEDVEARDDGEPTAPLAAPPDEAAASEDDKTLSVAEVVRLRNIRKGKLRGVEFRADDASRAGTSPENTEQSLVLHDAGPSEVEPIAGMSRRFAPQTGMVGELVNRHM